MRKWLTILAVVFGVMGVMPVEAQTMRLKTNLLYWTTATPNVSVEARLSDKWSADLSVGYNPFTFKDNKKWKHVAVQPEFRRWLKKTPYEGHFVGFNLLYSHFNAGGIKLPLGIFPDLHKHRQQGDLGAVGVLYGYDWPLKSCYWNIETVVGVGYGVAHYTKYSCPEHCATKISKNTRSFFMPTKLAVNVAYTIGGRDGCGKVEVPPVVEPAPIEPAPYIPPFEPKYNAVADNTGKAGELQRDNPVLQHISQYKPYDKTRILRKEKGALYVHFALDKSVLQHDFRDNAGTLDKIIDITRKIMADTTSSVRKIQIVGLASVEGPVAHNEELAGARAEALKRYIQREVPEAVDTLFDCANGGEAWTELRSQIDDNLSLPYRTEMLQIIDTEPNAQRRERRLKQLAGGRAYAVLRDKVLSDQRNSGYLRIYYDYVPDTAARTINRASDLLHAERYTEALRLLETVRSDKRSYNAMGVALYMLGRKDEAINYFKLAAEAGNVDAERNLEQLR